MEQDGLQLYQIQFGEYRSGSRHFLRCDMDVLVELTQDILGVSHVASPICG